MISGLFLGLTLSLAVALSSRRWGMLTNSGTFVTTIIGTLVFGLGRWKWTPAILFFFFSSSLLSKLGKAQKGKLKDTFQKGERRDGVQVLTNGILPAVCVLFNYLNHQPLWYIFYLASLTSATADTWGTEIGVLSRSAPILITTGERVPSGTSGGITWVGTGASLAGALALSAIGLFVLPLLSLQLEFLFVLIAVGFISALFDSFLGATLQAQYICPSCNKGTERKIHCQLKTKKISGWSWMNNDWVNFLSAWVAVALTFFLINK